MTDRMLETTVYLQMEGRQSRYWAERWEMHPVAMTKTKPRRNRAGCVVVKLDIRLPQSVLEPIGTIDGGAIEPPVDLVQRIVEVEVLRSDLESDELPGDDEQDSKAVV